MKANSSLKIYLVRHGQTNANANKIISGNIDSKLSPRGIEQANLLGKRLNAENFDFAYSSDLSRARETLFAVVDNTNAEHLKELRERNFGEFEGKDRHLYFDYLKNNPVPPHEFRPQNGENYYDVEKRIMNFWDNRLSKRRGTVLIAAHGGFNRSFIKLFCGLSFAEQFELEQANTCVNILEGSLIGDFSITLLNCTAHL